VWRKLLVMRRSPVGRTIRLLVICCLGLAPYSNIPAQQKPLSKRLAKNFRNWLTCDVDVLVSIRDVQPDFSVKVAFRGTPMSRVKLALRADDGSETSSPKAATVRLTDGSGIARFSAIPPGHYTLEVDEPLSPNFVDVRVIADAGKTDEVSFEWPDAVSDVRSVSGTLFSNVEGTPSKEARIELRDIRSLRVLEKTRTDSRGFYRIDSAAGGPYVLRITPRGSRVYRQLGVEVKESAAEGLPAFVLKNTGCGLELSTVQTAQIALPSHP